MHFEEVVKRISPKLKGIAYKLNGRFTFFNEDDLYQEALVHLWIDYKDGKLVDKNDSYILQGCYYHLKNYIRKTQNKVCLISMDTYTGNEEEAAAERILSLEDPKLYFEDINSKILIEEILNNGLTEREKEVLSLCLKGLTTRGIGKILGVSHVRVVKLRKRIRIKCQKFRNFI